jgi:hypothetical protein
MELLLTTYHIVGITLIFNTLVPLTEQLLVIDLLALILPNRAISHVFGKGLIIKDLFGVSILLTSCINSDGGLLDLSHRVEAFVIDIVRS